MRLIILISVLALYSLTTYANPINGKRQSKKTTHTSVRKKPLNTFYCETVCCTVYQGAIQDNNSILLFQLDNCTGNSTSPVNYESCVDAVFMSYQTSATNIFVAYSLCMYYSGING
jgi:hypothetical protein